MIRIERGSIKLPLIFLSPGIQRLKDEAKIYYSKNYNERSQDYFKSNHDFKITEEIKKSVITLFNGRCAYCESITEGEVDQFRPKRNARSGNGNSHPDHYWWLAYEWENQYLSCTTCNRNKGTWFPLIDNMPIYPQVMYPRVFEEKYLFIDPCNDYPDDHFSYDIKNGQIIPLTIRAEITIARIKLNRPELIRLRLLAISDQNQHLENFEVSKFSD